MRITYNRLGNKTEQSLRYIALWIALIFTSRPLIAMEEIIVDGTKEAAQVQEYQTLFESQMEAYSKAVSLEFKSSLKVELENAILDETRLATIRIDQHLLAATTDAAPLELSTNLEESKSASHDN
ncbi:MAG: hypothetical protein VX690_00400 [Pseudomonadota bacterium]|nr:hypothetical protein [Pseudomonadota bacterium]